MSCSMSTESKRCNAVEKFVWIITWWHHQMETFSALLAICAGNSLVTGGCPHKGQCRGALVFSLICTWINRWVNSGDAGDLRRHHAHYDVTIMDSDAILILNANRSCVVINNIWQQKMWRWLALFCFCNHCGDVFQITGIPAVCSTYCSGEHQRKHQGSAWLFLCSENPQLIGGFSAQRTSGARTLLSWRDHDYQCCFFLGNVHWASRRHMIHEPDPHYGPTRMRTSVMMTDVKSGKQTRLVWLHHRRHSLLLSIRHL